MTKVRPRGLSDRPRISVVIPCYNYGRFLPDCVDSVVTQEGVEVDVLIVDDASPDGSAAVAGRLADADPRVRLLAHEVNRGHIQTYNDGLADVDGEFVVLLSADDLLAPKSLARSAALLRARPDVGLVYGFAAGFVDVTPEPRGGTVSWSVWSGPDWIAELCRRVSNPVTTPDVMMRTSVMRELVGYDARLPHAGDFHLWLRAGARSSIGRINGVDQAFYRRHGANMHIERFDGVIVDLDERRRMFDVFFAEDGASVPGSERLRDVARQALAREALVTACQRYEQARDTTLLADLVAFAEETCGQAEYPVLWSRYKNRLARARDGRGTTVPRWVSAQVGDVADGIRWRRWRRYGLRGAVGAI